MASELAEVLVTVKTYPSPSDKYGETVCVAGVRLDGERPRWVRLYPVPFRQADYEQQFKKYQRIRLPLEAQGSRDPRPESMRPDLQHMELLGIPVDTGPAGSWERRRALLDGLIGATTTCDLIEINRATQMARPAPSLGLVAVRDADVSVEDGEPWDARQLAKAEAAAQPTLFGELKQLRPAPFAIRVKYRCAAAGCPGHEPKITDWEAGAAGLKWLRDYGRARARDELQKKWGAMFTSDRDTHVFVGNQHQHRHAFSILGVWYPPASNAEPLF